LQAKVQAHLIAERAIAEVRYLRYLRASWHSFQSSQGGEP
jgi:hypothetical protein